MVDAHEKWQINLIPALCDFCDWHYLVSAETLPLTCPHCHQAQLAAIPDDAPSPPTPTPELVIPFAISDKQISEAIKKFADSYYLEPRDLTAKNLVARAQRVYLPMWLVDTDVEATWHAEVGYDYSITTHNERYADGIWNSYDKQETRTRWEPRAGVITHHYANTRAPALDEHDELIEPLGKMNIWETELYEAKFLENSVVRLANRPKQDAWSEVVPSLMQLTEHTCQQAADGKEIRQFKWQPEFTNQHWTQLLLPIVTTYYLDSNGDPVPVILNGRTGQLSSKRVISTKLTRRIALLTAAIALVVFLLSAVLLFTGVGRGAAALAPLALVFGLASIIPFIYAASVSEEYSA